MNRLILLVLVVASLCCTGCVEEPVQVYERTLLVYMAGDNSLRRFVEENTSSIEVGLKSSPSNNTRIVVLFDDGSASTRLIEVTRKGRKTVIDYGKNLNTGDKETLRSVIKDVKRTFVTPHYGLILWSHGSAWLPPEVKKSRSIEQGPTQLAFGQDLPTDSWMSTDDLVDALDDDGYDFILFDACYMSSVELLYALRNKATYFIVSPTEILEDGFPYDRLVPLMNYNTSTREKALRELCKTYFDYYKGMTMYPFASISLIKSDALEDLALSIKEAGLTVDGLSVSGVQKFNRQYQYPCYDFTDAYSKASGGEKPWEEALSKVVLESYFTPYFDYLRIEKCSGLSTYIPQSSMTRENEAYRQTEWFRATVPQF